MKLLFALSLAFGLAKALDPSNHFLIRQKYNILPPPEPKRDRSFFTLETISQPQDHFNDANTNR